LIYAYGVNENQATDVNEAEKYRQEVRNRLTNDVTKQKVIRVEGSNRQELDYYLSQGWIIKNQTTISQGWAFGKTTCLGCLFLPLALLGRKPDIVEYILERK